MDAGELFKNPRLDWSKITGRLREHFSAEDLDLLFALYALEGYPVCSDKELRKKTKLKKKAHDAYLFKLQKKLFLLLKDENLEELLLCSAEEDERA